MLKGAATVCVLASCGSAGVPGVKDLVLEPQVLVPQLRLALDGDTGRTAISGRCQRLLTPQGLTA